MKQTIGIKMRWTMEQNGWWSL